ncbi:SMI1/KNR4 family protein [Pseudoalteromonas sp. TB64]|uniref:SMI1/KNR4 family protein n=1 Tax=Pseudoalteromonas sp. TB64 TaxID=1938600 RepID=UPI0003FBE95C|nr:SMI1/KNR4 family protein [Pseudoalteromonas sp. TB64]
MNDLKETCIKLNYLLEHTANVRFESGEEYSFILDKKYTEFEIESFEKAYQISLPEEYKNFLINVGASTLYIDEYGLGIKLYKLEDLEAFSKNVFFKYEKHIS